MSFNLSDLYLDKLFARRGSLLRVVSCRRTRFGLTSASCASEQTWFLFPTLPASILSTVAAISAAAGVIGTSVRAAPAATSRLDPSAE